MKKILSILFIFIAGIVNGQEFQGDFRTEISLINWKIKQINGEIELNDASFPNTIHEILFKHKIIENPYNGNNENKLNWIEESDWEATTEFKVEDFYKNDIHFITFKSIEPFTKIYLNGNFLFESKNAFVPYQIDISKYVRYGNTNELKIIFESPVRRSKEIQSLNKIYLPGDERVYVRKPQYEFGWDWGPRFVTTGMRDEIYYQILNTKYCDFKNISLKTKSFSPEQAEISCEMEIYSNLEQTRKLKINYGLETILDEKIKLKKGINIITRNIIQKNPELWWPQGMGAQYTYSYQFYLSDLKNKSNTEIISEEVVYSFCDIKLLKEKDNLGTSFYFIVNGKKCYFKGFNYIPDDHFKSNETELIHKIPELNANAVRIWGGGNYLTDDQLLSFLGEGIMIWQDFMFAGAMYPGDSAFLKNVEEEITYQVKKLRNYNNIALYCGNNEIDEAWHNWGWQKQYNYSKEDSTKIWNDYQKLFHELIPSIVKKYDHNTDYIPSSPEIGWGRKQSMTQGDSHYWGVWWGKESIETFEKKIPRFMSEFGMQSMPYMSTLENVIPKSKFNFESKEFKNHQKHPTGFETLNFYLEKYLSVPKDISDYAYATQVLQSITLEKAIQSQRLAQPDCMGTLIWQLNDTWPVISWSVIDSDGNKKLACEYIERSFADQIILQKKVNGNYEYYFSDLLPNSENKFPGNIKVKKFSGETLFDTTIENLNSGKIFEISNNNSIIKDSSHIYIETKVGYNNISIYYLSKLKNLQLNDSVFSFDVKMEIMKVTNSSPAAQKFESKKFWKVTVTALEDVHYVHLNTKANYEETNGEKYPPAEMHKGQTIEFLLPGDKYPHRPDAIHFIKSNLKCLNYIVNNQ